jgi:hypothetical protein
MSEEIEEACKPGKVEGSQKKRTGARCESGGRSGVGRNRAGRSNNEKGRLDRVKTREKRLDGVAVRHVRGGTKVDSSTL